MEKKVKNGKDPSSQHTLFCRKSDSGSLNQFKRKDLHPVELIPHLACVLLDVASSQQAQKFGQSNLHPSLLLLTQGCAALT